MTTFAQINGLVDAHVRRDEDRFRAIVLQIAAHAAPKSPRAADELRRRIAKAPVVSPLPMNMQGLLRVITDLAPLADMALEAETLQRLERVLLETRRVEELQQHGLTPTRKLLFTGPSGVGKTMGAGALALELQLPLVRIELHGIIASHMGETAAKLAQVFAHIKTQPAIYLFDEFDAIGAKRQNDSAPGAEMSRTLNSLLQFIEDDRSPGLIVATTNRVETIDNALFRRFDDVIDFAPPSLAHLQHLVTKVLSAHAPADLDLAAVYRELRCGDVLGHADAVRALERALKDYLMISTPITTGCVVTHLRQRRLSRGAES